MNARAYEQQGVHDSLVRMMAAHFATLGYLAIHADIQGYGRPAKIYWTGKEHEAYIPDLTCQKNDLQRTPIILEAETCGSLHLEHTKQQWTLFNAHALGNNGAFHVVVPRLCESGGQNVSGTDLVKQVASAWNVTVHEVWVPSR